MEVTLGLLMIMRKGNLYHLMTLCCILTRFRNQSCGHIFLTQSGQFCQQKLGIVFHQIYMLLSGA
uniref:Tho2 protein, putative n=1 Tax=Arundo donax TaxID=35708 RepID=A0A0A9E580_ARUDO